MRIGIGLALLAAMALSAAANAAVVEEFKAEDWSGLAFTSNETGEFTHCSVYAEYQNGSTLYISYEVSDVWFFSIANDSWSLAEGGSFDIKFKVDRRGEIEGTGTALGPTQVGLPVEKDHPFVGQLRRGNRLVISFQENDYAFELSNSNKAMNAARDCVRRHVQPRHANASRERQAGRATTAGIAAGEQAPAEESVPEEPAGRHQCVRHARRRRGRAAAVRTMGRNSDRRWGRQFRQLHRLRRAWRRSAHPVVLLRRRVDLRALPHRLEPQSTNESYSLSYNVDGPADAQSATKVAVDAPEPTRIFFEMNKIEDLIQRMESGKVLNLQLSGPPGAPESYSYPLDQAREAFEATRKCVRDHPAAPPEASGEETEVQEEAAALEADPGATGEDMAADSDAATPLPQIRLDGDGDPGGAGLGGGRILRGRRVHPLRDQGRVPERCDARRGPRSERRPAPRHSAWRLVAPGGRLGADQL